MTKKVFVAMEGDIIHPGNINVINHASKYGDIIVGLVSDELMAKTSRLPYLNWEQRKKVVENIKGVKEVIKQNSIEGLEEIKNIKPDIVVHGSKWKSESIKNKIIDLVKQLGIELIEIPYTKGISADELIEAYKEIGITPDSRRARLKKLLQYKGFITAMEAHNGLSGLIVEKTKINKEDGSIKEFDAMWLSSLTDSTAKGKPDIELVDVTSRVNTIQEIMEVTTKSIIYDGDTGGKIEHFIYTVRTLDRLGVSAIVIEDKIGLKKNSLFGTDVEQQQDTIENFVKKIQAGKNAKISDDFMIFARIESLILKKGMDDALKRAKAYVEGGADGIMIHSKEKEPDEIIEFMKEFRKFNKDIPVIAVPTSYNKIYEKELQDIGVNICIYANHLIRAAYPAMVDVSKEILKNERSYEVDNKCLSIKEIITLIPDKF